VAAGGWIEGCVGWGIYVCAPHIASETGEKKVVH